MRRNIYWAIILVLGTAGQAFAGPAVTIGGEERFRYEFKKDFDLNASAKDNGGLFFHRLRLNAKAVFGDAAEIFIEGLDAQTGAHGIKATANQTDDFDLHQAYVNLRNVGGSDLDIKLGRQELKYGKARLIDAPTWANRIRAFDAGVVHYDHNGFWGDILYGQDVKYDDDKLNTSRNEEMLAGTYFGYQKDKAAPLAEGYFLSLIDIKGTNDIHRYTVGARLQANVPAGALVDIEMPFQFGDTGTTTSGTKTIRAYALHADVSKSFEQCRWKPKLAAAYDEASGDKDPNDSVNNTFVPLYQSTHAPYGLMDLFRWQNVRNPEVSLTFSPTGKLKITPQADFFWLESKFDNWYNSSGGNVRTKTSGERGYYVGSEVSLRAAYDVNKNIKLESGYAHFFTGGYVKDSGADDEADWFYTQIVAKY
ncbi:MAG: alginate export family protein [Candidatus Omnitrophica bacterium]|nr:alginate export family protein [Candidatus Omnitrophota bacterium]